ncbi:ATP-binding protein [Sporolituus thermophilus]|uniref:ATP-binding protein n=1 Tax=Sporolituus thermophilus TaxID=608505 RepID=UPI000A591D1B|nr:anti-sigma regulatory factor [Sporolituus thermophilus]
MNADGAIVLEFPLTGGNFEGAGEASSKVKRVLQQLGIRPDIVRRIAIGAYEAEMNVIIHAWRGVLRACIYADHTELTIEDEGPGIANIEQAMQEGFSTAPDHIRELGFGAGMGLPNMHKCSDEFTIQSEVNAGTKIRMVIRHS